MTKVLIVIFDALRPEFLQPDLMPNLYAFAEQNVRYTQSRSTFPTETRVNQSAVLTGCYPSKHGIVGNRFPDGYIAPGAVINTGNDAEIAAAFTRASSGLITMPTMGERLADAGRVFATLSAGTPGGGRLINHTADINRTFRLTMRAPEATVPTDVLEAVERRIGPIPGYVLPATEWITWAVSAYLEYIVPDVSPDVMLLWLCEPDESFHFLGIGSEGSIETIRHVDAQFGRILKAHESAIDHGDLHIIAMSDHGQISLSGPPLDLPQQLNDAGFKTTKVPDPESDFTVVAGNAGGVWSNDPSKVPDLIDWLICQDWCGPIFTRTGEQGTLKNQEICADHERAPDINLILRHVDDPNEWNVSGTSVHDAPYPVGGGCHGGLSAHELHNVLVLGGAKFRCGVEHATPAGNIDILPTVLSLLDLPAPNGIDGRTLSEALEHMPFETKEANEQILRSPNGQTYLSVTDYGRQRYLNRAWVA